MRASLRRRASVLGVAFLLFLVQPGVGDAAVVTQAFTATTVTVNPPLVAVYDYTGAATRTWTTRADFDAGTYVNTNGSVIVDSIVLNRIGPAGVTAPNGAIAWWDTQWNNRRCFTIDHTNPAASSVTEYQLRLGFPLDALGTAGLLQSDYGDLRAVANDGVTQLPLWVDDTASDTIWVQVDAITAGATSDICLYYGYNAGVAAPLANHTETAVFSYTTLKPIYYAVSDLYDTPGAGVSVVTHTAANTVERSDGTSVTLAAAGDRTQFDAAGTNSGSVFSVLGPISSHGDGNGLDTLVPISFAGTRFVVPTSRDVQSFSFYAPFGDANVEIFDGATSLTTFTVPAGTAFTPTAGDITGANAAIIESDVPVLVTHATTIDYRDSLSVYPVTDQDLYGVRSTELRVGFDTAAGSVAVEQSDGSTSTLAGNRGDTATLPGGTAAGGGPADGIRLIPAQPVAAISQDDGDGFDSTVLLPGIELGSSYWIPDNSQYIAASCPTAGSAPVSLTVVPTAGAPYDVTCTGGPTVAWVSDTANLDVTAAAGIRIFAPNGEPFFAYYEARATDDETNLLGMKQGRQYTWPEPIVTAGADEGLYETSGTWESATFDTAAGSEVFGTMGLTGSEPAGTTLQVQVATSDIDPPTAFTGPDGTAATHFTLANLPSAVDFSHDGDRYVRIRAELATTSPADVTPQLDSAAVDYNLPRLARAPGTSPTLTVAGAIDPASARDYLLRIKTTSSSLTGSKASAVYRGNTNIGNLTDETLRLINEGLGIDSVQHSITLPTGPPVSFDPTRPHSIVIDHSALATGTTTIDFTWQLDFGGGGSLFIETDFTIEVIVP